MATDVSRGQPARKGAARRLLFLVPVIASIAVGVVLALGLARDPTVLPSTLIGRPVPTFSLPPVQGRTLGLSSSDLKGEVSLVNVFASWSARTPGLPAPEGRRMCRRSGC
jgi:hypothetical protein